MPTEPAGYNFAERVRLGAYRTREAGGLVWAYVGPPELEPAFPAFDWTRQPRNQIALLKFLQNTNYLQAADTLGRDPEYRAKVATMRDKLLVPKIGKWGQLQEWMEDRDDPMDQHRHVSHLFAVYPGRQISPSATPELAAAAKKSLEARGDGGTGWSRAWKIAYWARLQEGDHAYLLLKNLLDPVGTMETNYKNGGGTYPNLFDAHPPFQIDGNFGATAAIAEMLLQSQNGELHLLPALPKAWPAGHVKGLRARGGCVVNLAWQDGALLGVTLHGPAGSTCKIRYGTRVTDLKIPAGGVAHLDGALHTH